MEAYLIIGSFRREQHLDVFSFTSFHLTLNSEGRISLLPGLVYSHITPMLR